MTELKAKHNSEEDDPDIAWGRKNKITQSEKRSEYPMYKIANKTYWRDTTNPDAKSPSATKFTKCLKALKNTPSVKTCDEYFPEFMTLEDKEEYIAKIMTEYYTNESYGECLKQLKNDAERCEKFNFGEAKSSSTNQRKVEGGKRKSRTTKKRKSRAIKKRGRI